MSKKILVIDDEKSFCEMVKVRLESNGYKVFCAYDGQDGISKAKTENPDAILMDIMMPRMSGGDAVKLLKADSKTRLIPIIFLTAVLSKQEEDVGQKINIDNAFFPVIAKPFKPDAFLRKIREVLGE